MLKVLCLFHPFYLYVFPNGPIPASFCFIFGLFRQTVRFLQEINVKNAHVVFGAGIRTYNLINMSRFTWPLDQGSLRMFGFSSFSLGLIFLSFFLLRLNVNLFGLYLRLFLSIICVFFQNNFILIVLNYQQPTQICL